MKIKYYDHVSRQRITVKVNAKTGHFLEKKREERKENLKNEKEVGLCSLSSLLDNGFQISDKVSLDDIVIFRDKERKYLNSNEYKQFRLKLKKEIKNKFDKMSEQVRTAMFLRFFKEMSISQIAAAMHCHKATAQTYLQRGTKVIGKFLNRDIQEQDEIERRAQEKALREFLAEYNETH